MKNNLWIFDTTETILLFEVVACALVIAVCVYLVG